MKIRFLNLSVKDKLVKKSYENLFKKFLSKGNFVMGKEVEKFETKISGLTKKKYTVGVSSGTNAIYLALKACGIKRGDHVLVPCLSWLSTFTACKHLGAIPVGIDINEDLQINVELIKKNITRKTRAIIIVHFTGYLKNYNKLKELCDKKKIFLIEDAAQSFGARISNKPAGSFGHLSCFSMNPMKVLAALGDAGTVSTDNLKQYNKLLSLRYAGTINKEKTFNPDLNHKIDTLQCLVLSQNLKNLKNIIKKRIKNAQLYESHLTNKIIKPPFKSDFQHVYYTYSIICKSRDELKKYLSITKGIETKIQHPFIISDHPGLKDKHNLSKKFPVGNKIKKEILSLPIHEKLNKKEIFYIIKAVNNFYEK